MWQVIWAALRSYCDNQSDWEQHLTSIAFALRATPSASSKYSPSMVLFGKELELPMETALLPTSTGRVGVDAYLRQLLPKLQIVRQVAFENLQAAQETYKHYYDRNQHPAIYEPGDLVWLRNFYIPKGICAKLRRKFDGPYFVVSRTEHDTYKLRHSQSNELLASAVHLNRLRPYDNERQVLWDRFADLMASSPTTATQTSNAAQSLVSPDVDDTSAGVSADAEQTLPGIPTSFLSPDSSSDAVDSSSPRVSDVGISSPTPSTSAVDVSPTTDALSSSQNADCSDINNQASSSTPFPSTSQAGNGSQDSSSQIWFPASKLLACKVQNGRRMYRVKWDDNRFQPTWEFEENVTPALKDAFHATFTWAGKKRKTAPRRAPLLTLSLLRLLTSLFVIFILFSF